MRSVNERKQYTEKAMTGEKNKCMTKRQRNERETEDIMRKQRSVIERERNNEKEKV